VTQLERLARPVPAKYIKPPAKGKFGESVPHYIVNQIALAIVGPFTWKVREFIYGADGTTIEGCVGYLKVTIDGETIEVEEVGDCEQPDNWKTNGQRAKDAASDAFKRCWMRPSLGLHLRDNATYFLYEQLKSKEDLESSGSIGASVSQRSPVGPESSGPVESPASSRSASPGPEANLAEADNPSPNSATRAGSVSLPPEKTEPPATPHIEYFDPGKASLETALSRCSSLAAVGVDIKAERDRAKLPTLRRMRDEADWISWQKLLADLETKADKEAEKATA
jgi:hypothetical protein